MLNEEVVLRRRGGEGLHALVSASLVVRAGQGANPADRPGLASFVAAMLPEGTTTRSAQQIAETAAALGATLTTSPGAEEARVQLSGLKATRHTEIERVKATLK